ncbi:chemotaxis protein CheW [Selenihalanaerobacter shriftii]|uniref:Chemotaxis protein CheW n=1 Tax=Selenihalanaerobacter shriftii TaxID=142842 RepID=A0A1T4MC61_9FIRM|nr:chemotaxis protein CheW [Selenihalanaerobacter shriftii]SJZ64630.1 purine-binding chemotaxis protein CheW [Selenihalanaerobacter shriftii]
MNQLQSKGIVTDLELVIFRLNQKEYGVKVLETQEIIEMQEITRVPNVPKFIRGIINLRGQIIPTIDLKKRFNLKESKKPIEERIIIVEAEGNKVGIVVDEVIEILDLSNKQISPSVKINREINEKYLKKVFKFKDRSLILLNLTPILSPDKIKEVGLNNVQKD